MKQLPQTFRHKKSYTLISLLLLALVVVGGFHLYKSQNDYQALLQACNSPNRTKYTTCLTKKIREITNNRPEKTGDFLTYIYSHARRLQPVDLRYFSEHSHFAGMELAEKRYDLTQAADICGNAFKGACLHGFVMERLDRQAVDVSRLSTLSNYCNPLKNDEKRHDQYLNCLHGVGHELWAKGQATLSQSISYCNPLSKPGFKSACWSGALMEYSRSGISQGFHTHTPVGSKELPCETLQLQYEAVCYAAAGSYRQYAPNQGTVADSYNYCAGIPRVYSQPCQAGVAERLDLAVGKL